MDASRVGEFELELTAPFRYGEHELTVVIVGQNYVAELPLTIVVQ